MAKPKTKVVNPPKKRSTKYSKLAAVAVKELNAKKAALVRAEKALAKAQRNHSELLSEVARLDMLDRSLKALINGTEPPQNVRYVYTYPQWVWYNNPYGWNWNGNTYLTGGQTGYNFQGGQQQMTITNPSPSITTTGTTLGGTFTNANMTPQLHASLKSQNGVFNCSSNSINTVTTGAINSGVFTTTADSGLTSGSSISLESAGTSSFLTAPQLTFCNTSHADADFTVDLSSGAVEEEPKADMVEEVVES